MVSDLKTLAHIGCKIAAHFLCVFFLSNFALLAEFFWYCCYYPHWSRDSLSPVCGKFFFISPLFTFPIVLLFLHSRFFLFPIVILSSFPRMWAVKMGSASVLKYLEWNLGFLCLLYPVNLQTN